MYRNVLIISIVVILVLAGYFLYPIFKGKFQHIIPVADIEQAYTAWLTSKGLSDPIPDINIVITKDNRVLYLMSGDQMIDHWDVALSLNPDGKKTDAHDGKTPVGEYHITRHELRSEHHLMLFINYPNLDDANAAMNAGKITELEHREIMTGSNKGLVPPDDTTLGGGLGIHGGGTLRDWTDGSFAVDDQTIEILWGAVPDGTPVTIYEKFTDWEMSGTLLSY